MKKNLNLKETLIGGVGVLTIFTVLIGLFSYLGSVGNSWTIEQAEKNANSFLIKNKIVGKVAPAKSDTDKDGNSSVAILQNNRVIVLRCDNQWFLNGSCNVSQDINGSRLNHTNSKGRNPVNTFFASISGSTDSVVKSRMEDYLRVINPEILGKAIIDVKYNTDNDDNNTVSVSIPGSNLSESLTYRCDNTFALFGIPYKGGCVPTTSYTGFTR
jgi:hypothetical protein